MLNSTKVALVTGGNRGIGFETVRQLAEKGLTVPLLAARIMEEAEQAAASLKERRSDGGLSGKAGHHKLRGPCCGVAAHCEAVRSA